MRPLKFRAWDKEYGHMYQNAYPFEHLVYVEMHDNDETFEQYKHKMEHVNGKWFYFIVAKDMEVMQFTGWLDHNKQEIYEGDIVQIGTYHGEVVWDIINDGWRIRVGNTFNLRANEMEVIGNVWEHPQLLPP